MSFIDRTYPDIVDDVLISLTQGVAGEPHRPEPDADGNLVLVLDRRPVRRVSKVSGFATPSGATEPTRVVFSLSDYEVLPADPADPEDHSRIRFLPFGRRPDPGSVVTVNYYPRTTDRAPLNDVSVGSIVRTLLEAVAREHAVLYAQLNAAYDGAFLDSAEGSSLDRVVALLGYQRYRAGRPVGSVRFRRRPGTPGEVTIPAGTPVTDKADTVRYETVETRTMLAGESTAVVRVRGATDTTRVAGVGELEVVQRAIAGVDQVTNEQPTTTASADETDVELRNRARVALLVSNKGTSFALRDGLLALPEVRSVSIEERPDGVPGEVRVTVSLTAPTPDGSLPARVLERIEELRPAGINILKATAGQLDLAARVSLVLAGSSLPAVEREQVHASVTAALTDLVGRVGVGQKVRTGPLVAPLLADQRVVDAVVRLGIKGTEPAAAGADLDPGPGRGVRLAPAEVTFEEDAFDQPLAAPGVVEVEVRASVAAQAVTGTSLEQVRAAVEERLRAYVAGLAPPAQVTAAALLAALRDDAHYGIDPLRLLVTFTTADQFVQVAQGGAGFDVRPGQRFTVVSVEVVA